ncbi:MAG: gliding motility-associated C-terminal domain-containing protein [Chitinophagales bacterium]
MNCDSTHYDTVSLAPFASALVDVTRYDSAQVLSSWYYASTSFNDTLVGGASNGCDSITTFNITINNSVVTSSTYTSCNPADVGINVSNLLTSLGCDSTHYDTVSLAPFASATVDVTECDSAQVLSSWYYASTSFNDTLVGGASNGCDSITTFNIMINNSVVTSSASTSCNPADVGIDVTNLLTSLGCDSTHYDTVSLAPFASATVDITECDSALVLSSWYYASTSFNDTLIGGASNGCDSITTFNITINNSVVTTSASTSCNPADVGIDVTNLLTSLGCDSTHYDTVSLAPFASATVDIIGCDSAQVLSSWYYASTSFNDTLVGGASNGCDSITTFNITINSSTLSPPSSTAFNTGSNGSGSTLPGASNDLLWTVSSTTINGIYNPAVVMSSTPAVYYNSPWADATWIAHNSTGSHSVDQSFYYQANFDLPCEACVLNSFCLNLDVFSDNTITEIYVNGIPQSQYGNFTPNSGGFSSSSIVSVSLCNDWQAGNNSLVFEIFSTPGFAAFLAQSSINPPPVELDSINQNICSNAFYTFGGNNLNVSGIYYDTLQNVLGCDSIIVLNLTVNPTDTSFSTSFSCSVADTGVFEFNLINSFGCDSTHYDTVSLLPTAFAVSDLTACDSALVQGTWYFATTSFIDTLVGGASNGCDSITTFNITINNSVVTSSASTSCNPADVGIDVTNLLTSLGCDSTHYDTVSLAPFASAIVDLTECDSAQVLSSWYYASTSFNDTLVGGASNGCDSITTFNITINNSVVTSSASTSCNPADVGINVSNLLTSLGCDSTHYDTVSLAPFASATVAITECDSALILSSWYYASTSFNDTLVGGASNGCDSITTFNITINNSVVTSSASTSCNPADVGINVSNLLTSLGCDSTHYDTVSLLPTAFAVSDLTACDSALVQGTWYFASTSFNDTLVGGASNGCDSITTLNITINNSVVTTSASTSCNPADVGIDVTNLLTSLGCDSTHYDTVSLAPFASATVAITECDSAQVLSTWYFASTSINDTLVGGASNGCDSITTFNITINNSVVTTSASTSCNPADVGINVSNLLTSLGCDSTHYDTVILLPTAQGQANLSACDSIQVLGTWYFASTSFNDTIIGGATNGCDSITAFNLVIHTSATSSESISACESYTINGQSYTSSQQIILNLNTINSCDSIHIIDLTISNSSTDTLDLELCPYDFPFLLADNTTMVDGPVSNFSISIPNSQSCDSIIVYNITSAPAYAVSPDNYIAYPGDSVNFIIENESINSIFSYESNIGVSCPGNCGSYSLYPTTFDNYYYFTIIDTSSSCIFRDTLLINLEFYSELNVPNIFTPNGDGQNDIYRSYGKDISSYKLEIFDRWGGKMYETTVLENGWDGIFKNLPVESGIYIAVIQAVGIDGQKFEITQNIKLVR